MSSFVPGILSLAATLSVCWSGHDADDPAANKTLAQFEQRRSACRAGDVEEELKLASWAVDRQLPDQADTLYRSILERDPDNSEAYLGLLAAAEHRELPSESATYRAARKLLPADFREYFSDHFAVISNADASWSKGQLNVLERAHSQFQRFASRLNLRPLPLQHRLICILFADRDQYREFALSNDLVENSWITGYYSPRHDWVVFYDPQFSPEVMQARVKLQELQQQVDDLKRQASAPASPSAHASPPSIHDDLVRTELNYQQQRRRIDEYTARESSATTIHEAIHQLLFHSRVQAPSVRYPLWICEGLATNFETEDPARSFGPGRDYAARRNRFCELLQSNQLIGLRELVQIDRVGSKDDDARIDAIYQGSYALIGWLSRFRKDGLRLYLLEMRRQPAGDMPPERHLELFEMAFGDIDALERVWLRYERSQLKPPPDKRRSSNEGASASGMQPQRR